MSIINGILIPADNTKPIKAVFYEDEDHTNLTALIFDGDRTGTFTCMTLSHYGEEVSLWGDDEGLLRSDAFQRVNARAMQLYSYLSGSTLEDFTSPLVGDWVVLGGYDDEGGSLDCPGWVQDFPFSWALKPVQGAEA